jgi:hypothetical protein
VKPLLKPVTADVDGANPAADPAANPGTPRVPLGRLLVAEGLLTEIQVDDALYEGSQTGERLGEIVVRRGLVSEEDIARLLAAQWELSYVDRASIWFDADALARLSREDAQRLEAMPTRVQDGRVVVAVAEPTEQRLAALRDVIGEDTVVVVVPKTALDAAISSELLTSRRPAAEQAEPEPPPSAPDLRRPAPPPELHPVEEPAEPPPAVPSAPEPARAAMDARGSETSSRHETLGSAVSGVESVAALAQQARSVADSIAAQAAAMREEVTAYQKSAVAMEELQGLRTRIADLEAELDSRRALAEEVQRHLEAAVRALRG